MTTYPYPFKCGKCGRTVYIQYSAAKNVEYATDNKEYPFTFHNCHIKAVKAKPKKPLVRIEDIPTDDEYPGPSTKETIDAYIEPTFTPADQVIQIKGKIAEITISRTVSYKYGVSQQYATEKEEIFESFTYGTKTEVDISQGDHALENAQLLALNDVNGIIHEHFTKHLNYRLIDKTGLLRK